MKKTLLLWLLMAGAALAQAPLPSVTPLIPTPTPSPTPDISVMVARLKAAKALNKPFIIYYQGGQALVPNNTFIALNPSGKFTWIVVFSGDDTVESIPVVDILKLVLVSNYPFD
jgi:hypothetical protein